MLQTEAFDGIGQDVVPLCRRPVNEGCQMLSNLFVSSALSAESEDDLLHLRDDRGVHSHNWHMIGGETCRLGQGGLKTESQFHRGQRIEMVGVPRVTVVRFDEPALARTVFQRGANASPARPSIRDIHVDLESLIRQIPDLQRVDIAIVTGFLSGRGRALGSYLRGCTPMRCTEIEAYLAIAGPAAAIRARCVHASRRAIARYRQQRCVGGHYHDLGVVVEADVAVGCHRRGHEKEQDHQAGEPSSHLQRFPPIWRPSISQQEKPSAPWPVQWHNEKYAARS
jgi:hypothetical protein